MTGTALVVYESMFGNTRDLAHAVAEGLGSGGRWEVLVREVGHAPDSLAGFDLLVLGGPTHALTLSNPRSRADAAHRTDRPLVSAGPGLREWIAAVDVADARTLVATFDTRLHRPLLVGSAARAATRRLRKRGLTCTKATSFWVQDVNGPLAEGEEARARQWAGRFVPPPPANPDVPAGSRPPAMFAG